MASVPTVLFSQRSLTDPTNPYTQLLFESLADHVQVLGFSWRNALVGKYDLVHLQWPEYILREKRARMKLLNFCLSYLWLIRLSLKRTPVVETIHNLKPHDQASYLERIPLSGLRRLVCRNIYLNRSTENDLNKGPVILHGHYSDIIQRVEPDCFSDQRLYFLFFGLLRPYKGMEKLINAYSDYDGPVDKLLIAGWPINEEYGESLKKMAADDPRISLDLRHVPESELASLVSNAVGVVLPYEYMYNSGALIYALSAGTPVLAPASPANSAIQDEVGPGWLLTFDESVRAADLVNLASTRQQTVASQQPNLAEREWRSIGVQHASLYKDLLDGQ